MQLKKYTLGELMEVTRGMSLSGEYYSAKGNLIRLTLGNFDYKNNCFKNDKSKDNLFFTGAVKPEFILSKGDIITPLTEQAVGLLGSTAKIPCSETYIQSQDVALIKCNEKLNPQFAFYLIPSKIVRNQLSAAAQQTKIRHTSPDKIKNCTVWIPEYSVQEKIGNVLSTLDEKIALNNRINTKLEAMAKRLYDYWFVQFEFPFDFAQGKPDADGTFGIARPPISQAGHTSTAAGQSRTYKTGGGKMVWNEQLKREIPEGWEVKRLGDLFTTNRGVSYSTKTITGDKGIPMINLASFSPDGSYKIDGIKLYTDDYPKDKVLKPYDLVMCNTQQTAIDFSKDIIGKAMLVPDIFSGDITSSHHVNTLKCSDNNLKFYLYRLFNTDYYHAYISHYASGTNIMGLDFAGVENYICEIPPTDILKKFSEIILNIEKKKSEIIRENKKLTVLRDRLLPLLMNGQVAVSDNSEQTKQNSGLDYEKKFNKWLQNQGLAARGYVDMKTLRAIFNAMDDDDK